jgi:hypothetical protein
LTRFLEYFGRIIGLNSNEFQPVLASWGLSFLIRFSIIIGWTVLTVYFVVNYGINAVLYLFLLHAIGVIIGTILFSEIVNRFEKESLLVGLSILAAATTFFAGFVYEYSLNSFLVLSFVAISIFTGQLKVVRMLFSEEMFSPSQSLRVFPIIESAETVGIIFGGLVVSTFAYSFSVPQFMYIWSISLLLIVPMVMTYSSYSVRFPLAKLMKTTHDTPLGNSRIINFFNVFSKLKLNNFVFYLVLIIGFQWVFSTLLEFQYTKAIEEAIHGVSGAASAGVAKLQFSTDFAKDLGNIQAGIGFFALFFQLFVASKLMTYLGTFGSLLIYPIVLIFSMIGLTTSYGYVTAITTKFNQEIANILHYNSYHGSYYLVKHNFRGVVAEFIEGFARPVGAIIGTLFIITLIEFKVENINMVISLIAISVLLIMLLLTIRLKKSFLSIPKTTLIDSNSASELLNAFDLLIQNKSEELIPFLVQLCKTRPDLPLPLLNKIFDYIALNGDEYVLSDLISLFSEEKIKYAPLLNAINSIFINHYEKIKLMPFTWNALRNFYKFSLEQASDKHLNTVPYLIIFYYKDGKIDDVIRLINTHNHPDTIRICLSLVDKNDDPQLYSYLRSLFVAEPKHHEVVDLLEKVLVQDEFDSKIVEFLTSGNKLKIESALIYILRKRVYDKYADAIAKIKLNQLKSKSVVFLFSLVDCLKKSSKACLYNLFAKLDYADFELTKTLLDKTDRNDLQLLMKSRIEFEVHSILDDQSLFLDSYLTPIKLKNLKYLYFLLGNEKEYYVVEEFVSLSVAS